MKPIFFILISQFLLVSSVSAYSVNQSYDINDSAYSYGYSFPYVYTYSYYGPSNTTSSAPRTITIECKDNNPPGAPGTISYLVGYLPTCNSITGEGSPSTYLYSSQNSQNQPTFSGFSNYRCVSYYYNGQCSVYRYDTTYTPPKTYFTMPSTTYYPYYYNTPTTIPTAPVVSNATPACKDQQPGVTYTAMNINCTCPDGTISGSMGVYYACGNSYGSNTVAPYSYTNQYNYNQYPITYSQSTYELSQYSYK